MAKIERKLKNSLFLVAVDYLFREKIVESQKEFCKRIGITAPTLSRIKSNETTVSDNTIRKMNDEFDGRFNMAYFRGESQYFLVSDTMKADEVEKMQHEEECKQPIDQSGLVDAVRAAKDETISELRERLKEKDERLKEKDELIAALRRQLTNVGHSVMYKTIDDNPIPLAAENV
jgi:transcriptional regulator with XRE-family HTH domain